VLKSVLSLILKVWRLLSRPDVNDYCLYTPNRYGDPSNLKQLLTINRALTLSDTCGEMWEYSI